MDFLGIYFLKKQYKQLLFLYKKKCVSDRCFLKTDRGIINRIFPLQMLINQHLAFACLPVRWPVFRYRHPNILKPLLRGQLTRAAKSCVLQSDTAWYALPSGYTQSTNSHSFQYVPYSWKMLSPPKSSGSSEHRSRPSISPAVQTRQYVQADTRVWWLISLIVCSFKEAN